MTDVTTSDGVRLYAEATGSGLPVLFIHEFAADILSQRTRFNETPAARIGVRLTGTGPAAPFRANFSETRSRFSETGQDETPGVEPGEA